MLAARITAARRLPQVALTPKRLVSSVREGSVAQSKGFKRADEYIRKQEQLELQKLKAQIEQKKLELEKLEKEANDIKKD
ncbi:hypothetical protein V5O48_007512 [Marasmius crinis-equi]|uniref:ATPase inhibitor n=1 Tax=Marasmius crinis-equi TaxID=585013 RepID=A0ABR3FGH3_9AGAR